MGLQGFFNERRTLNQETRFGGRAERAAFTSIQDASDHVRMHPKLRSDRAGFPLFYVAKTPNLMLFGHRDGHDALPSRQSFSRSRKLPRPRSRRPRGASPRK